MVASSHKHEGSFLFPAPSSRRSGAGGAEGARLLIMAWSFWLPTSIRSCLIRRKDVPIAQERIKQLCTRNQRPNVKIKDVPGIPIYQGLRSSVLGTGYQTWEPRLFLTRNQGQEPHTYFYFTLRH